MLVFREHNYKYDTIILVSILNLLEADDEKNRY